MKKHFILILCYLLLFQTTFSQIKKIEGDTVHWLKHINKLQQKFALKDFEKFADRFSFRFWNNGQIVEITKDSSHYNGLIVNYIYRTKNSKRHNTDTLHNRIYLTTEQAKNIYAIIKNSNILKLPSSNSIKNWKQGLDGTTYMIEHADTNSYWLKTYWTPSAQDSLKEALTVLQLEKGFLETLKLREIYSLFKDNLPKKGCYHSGGMGVQCFISNSLVLGYSGASKLPFGFFTAYNANYIGKTKVNSAFSFQYNFDNYGYHHLNFHASNWNIFYEKSNLNDFVSYNYQNRKINIVGESRYQNHQFKYGINIKNHLGIGMGLDYLNAHNERIGGHVYIFKSLSKPNISAVLTSSFFHNYVNYKAEIFKSINFNNSLLVRNVSLGIAYEDFFYYKDLYFTIRILI